MKHLLTHFWKLSINKAIICYTTGMTLYTLWVVPPTDIQKQLQEIVDDLSTKFHGPTFEPHMTLLGDIPIEKEAMVAKSKELVKQLRSFPVSLGELSFSTTYFQSVFVRVNATAALMDANLKAKAVFGIANTVFMPHISLLYGEQSMEERERAVLEAKVPDGISFTVNKLVITPSRKDPNEWEHIAELAFEG